MSSHEDYGSEAEGLEDSGFEPELTRRKGGLGHAFEPKCRCWNCGAIRRAIKAGEHKRALGKSTESASAKGHPV